MEIVVPDPSLVVLIGPAGAGKSTFAARHFAADEVFSSDAFRAIVAGDEADQRATRPAFSLLHRQLARRVSAGRLAVVDATNVEPHARRALVRRALAASLPAVAIVLDLPAAIVLARNAARTGRTVNPAIVRRHLDALAALTGVDGRAPAALAREGFAATYVLATVADLDLAVVTRAATLTASGSVTT